MSTKKNSRLKRRVNEISKDESKHASSAHLRSKSDSELFVVDNVGDIQKRRRISSSASKEAKRRKKEELSHLNQRQIQNILKRNDVATVLAMVQQKKKKPKKPSTNYDLWEETSKKNVVVKTSVPMAAAGTAPVVIETVANDGVTKNVSNATKKARDNAKSNRRSSVAVDVALPGQSYRPDEEHHQDAIGEALAIEIRRKEALDYKNKPLATGMSEETLALILPDDASDDDDSSSSEDESSPPTFHPKKQTSKLTRAQKNKKRRIKLEQHAIQQRKEEKKFLHSVGVVKRISKDLKKEEQERLEKKQVLDQLKQEKESKPLGTDLIHKSVEMDPITAPALPVALSSELQEFGGKLRTVKPKGSLLKERLDSLADRKLANRKQVQKKHVLRGKKRKFGKQGNEHLLLM